MKCLFRRHKFKRLFGHAVGGLAVLHLECKNCKLRYSFFNAALKKDRSHIKHLRIKI